MSVAGVDELDPALVHGLIRRANDPKFERWQEQVRRTGACRHPVRLRGVVRRGDEVVYSTATEPDRALMVRCGNRREAFCPACSREYRGDLWQLVNAGLAGGRKGVPEQVAEHPRVFASLTAPSFGPVHGGVTTTGRAGAGDGMSPMIPSWAPRWIRRRMTARPALRTAVRLGVPVSAGGRRPAR